MTPRNTRLKDLKIFMGLKVLFEIYGNFFGIDGIFLEFNYPLSTEPRSENFCFPTQVFDVP